MNLLLTLLSPFQFFTDPVLRAPTIGSMLMCIVAGLVGALVFLRKQSLVGEALSHAAYPGVMFGVLVAGALAIPEYDYGSLSILILVGAFITSYLGLELIHFMQSRLNVKGDAALCFILSAFFGIGLTFASEIQFSYTSLYKQAQIYLYGQAATMTDMHIAIYGIMVVLMVTVITAFYKEFLVITFDRYYARTLGMSVRAMDTLLFVLIVVAVVIGIRSVGVVLMSAMLIAPAVAARQFTRRLSTLLFFSALFGMLSGFFGNYFSVLFSEQLAVYYPKTRLALPTGPMIVMVAAFICLSALLFAPERGIVLRVWRVAQFRNRCVGENLLKAIWRLGPKATIPFEQIFETQDMSRLRLRFLLWRLKRKGWITTKEQDSYSLTHQGGIQAAKIVRLHRLWEVYLAEYMGVGVERVHRNAEEMEHIITPELENALTLFLRDPKVDPHHQPIPPKEVL